MSVIFSWRVKCFGVFLAGDGVVDVLEALVVDEAVGLVP
jgi:hypothetical protein